jgi:hypothetical protein
MPAKCLYVDLRGMDCPNDALDNSNFCAIHDDSSGLMQWREAMKTAASLIGAAAALITFAQQLATIFAPHMKALDRRQASELADLIDRGETLKRVAELQEESGTLDMDTLVNEFDSIVDALGKWESGARRTLSAAKRIATAS